MKLLRQTYLKTMKKLKKIRLLSIILCLALILAACGKSEEQTSGGLDAAPAEIETQTASMVVLGDNLMHMPVVNDGKQPDGSYDYSKIYSQLSQDIKGADIAVIGQETVLGGEELGLSGYPLFNSPQAVGENLVKEGFDVVLHASNHVMDRNTAGIEKTLEFWDKYPEITVLGINESEEMQNTVKIIEQNGIIFALLNYTYGTNGIPLPQGKEYMVNLIDEDKIKQDIKSIRNKVDFVVVFPHWGNEYQMTSSPEQEDLAMKMCQWGADVIIGSHPHVIEPCEWIESDNGNRAVVYYSLGNFVSRQKETKNLLGAMASLEFTKHGDDKTVAAKFTPIVTHYNYNSADFVVYKLKDYTDEMAKSHGINLYDGTLSAEKFKKIYEGVIKEAPKGIELEI